MFSNANKFSRICGGSGIRTHAGRYGSLQARIGQLGQGTIELSTRVTWDAKYGHVCLLMTS